MPAMCVVAGDPSGDAHAAALVRTLHSRRPDLRFTGLGGPALHAAGVELLADLTRTAAIGPFDAARHLGHFLHVRRLLQHHLNTVHPEIVLLVDFGDFNLPIVAPMAKRAGCRVVSYISPQLWAWGSFRLRWVRRYVDRMLVLFQFEEAFYRRRGVPVTWVGHPLVDTLTTALSVPSLGLNAWRTTVGLLPGSRRSEVQRHLPLLCRAAAKIAWRMPGIQFLVVQAPTVEERWLAPALHHPGVDAIITQQPFHACAAAMEAAITVSGTATLEAALYGVPMIVVYKTSWPTYLAARAVVRVPHIAMANVIAGTPIVPELVQHRATPTRIARELVGLLRDPPRLAQMKADLARVTASLGPPHAVERAAQCVLDELEQSTVHRQ